jgi:hypothetical protein
MTRLRVLIACEYSGRVRDAFIAKGHDAISCDILPTESPGPHILDDVLNHLDKQWDMMIAFPPCTHLANSGARWFDDKIDQQKAALEFVRRLLRAEIPRLALENPVGMISYYLQDPTQYVHPWQFGHGESKKTCLWLKNLPALVPTNIVEGRSNRMHMMGQSKNRSKLRSLTYQGIALAMADQWSENLPPITQGIPKLFT